MTRRARHVNSKEQPQVLICAADSAMFYGLRRDSESSVSRRVRSDRYRDRRSAYLWRDGKPEEIAPANDPQAALLRQTNRISSFGRNNRGRIIGTGTIGRRLVGFILTPIDRRPGAEKAGRSSK